VSKNKRTPIGRSHPVTRGTPNAYIRNALEGQSNTRRSSEQELNQREGSIDGSRRMADTRLRTG
jgi:hypothetical protein